MDDEIFSLVKKEEERQRNTLDLIASENYTSKAVLEITGSVLTNKYSEGYPGKRYYAGNEFIDQTETLAIERAKKLFKVGYANVQPHAGAIANLAAFQAFLNPGDKIMGMDLSHGGHLTHGSPVNFSGKLYNVVSYGVSKETETIDYDEVMKLAKQEKPNLIICGYTAYPRTVYFDRFKEIANEVGAVLLADIAHIAGLIAGEAHPSPAKYADVITSTTHKTLRGPRGAIILTDNEENAKKINKAVFPGVQGGPLDHVIAAKAVCFYEALQPEFKDYARQVVKNAKVLAEELTSFGYRLVSGGTDNHLMLVDLTAKEITGKEAQHALEEVSIIVNRNTVPFDTRSPFITSGIRLGTPALTTRGLKEPEIKEVASLIHRTLKGEDKEKIRGEVHELVGKFPIYA
ncbi:serine hydroxymethyltransferase [Candidatus Micrarchaeota archaeon]|nr:serine hydroxymethyltransferase [Candidatus Micrarchaeota archaeon]